MMSGISHNNSYQDAALYQLKPAPVSEPPQVKVDLKVEELKRTEESLRMQHRAFGDSAPGSGMRFHYAYGPDGKRYIVDVVKSELKSKTAASAPSSPKTEKAQPHPAEVSAKELGTIKGAQVENLKAELAEAEAKMASLDSDYDHLMEMEIAELRRLDADVRAHEAAHVRAGGALAGPPRFQYQLGPDGKMYAVGGEVNISIPRGRTPEETLRIMNTVKAAATAVGDPSPADRRVASYAARRIQQAMQEVRKMQQEEMAQKQEASIPKFLKSDKAEA